MPRRRTPSPRVAQQVAELALAAPQVIALRTARLAAAGHSPSRQDQAEFVRMGSEKLIAFQQSWAAMWLASWRVQVMLAQAVSSGSASALAEASRAALGVVLSAGLAPIHRRAVSNARRLSRGRRRS